MQEYCIYLRKSRADLDAEAHGEGETLARHERTLLELARRGKYNITEIYKEIVSGETITSRPVVTQLLREVEQGRWAGVLVMEVERLARGDAIDQGTVARAFKYSNTKIITPMKIYDPANQFDEEYFEFGLFMSRQEYRTINRRLKAGRIAASKEGKAANGKAAYGYVAVPVVGSKGTTFRPVEPQASTVRLIFRLFVYGDESDPSPFSITKIVRRLESLSLDPPGGKSWYETTVRRLLSNPVYAGKIRYGKKRNRKIIVNGIPKVKAVRVPDEDTILVDGLHEAIVSEELFNAAQARLSSKLTRNTFEAELVNPFAGIARCALCGRALWLRYKNGSPNQLSCPNHNCPNISCYYTLFESRVLEALSSWLSGYQLELSTVPDAAGDVATAASTVEIAKKNLASLESQLERTHTFLEQGVYSTEVFLERSRILTERIATATTSLSSAESTLADAKNREANRKNIVPKVKNLIEVYYDLPSASAKNEMLKDVLEKIEYCKKEKGRRNRPADNFELTIYPKLPPLN